MALEHTREGVVWRKPLPCRRWRCEQCAKRLRRGVMALGAAGNPNKLLTLTLSREEHPEPNEARETLHKCWRKLRHTVSRELARPKWARWHTPAGLAGIVGSREGRGLDCDPAPAKHGALPYFAVVERHQDGRPHLHLMLRCEGIPQWWLSAQMKRLAASPIVDIRAITGTKAAVGYVAKYLGKQPARFGASRAYWYSRTWAPKPNNSEITVPTQKGWFRVVRWCAAEQIALWQSQPVHIDVTEDGFIAVQDMRRPIGLGLHFPQPPPIRPETLRGRGVSQMWSA